MPGWKNNPSKTLDQRRKEALRKSETRRPLTGRAYDELMEKAFEKVEKWPNGGEV